MQQAAKIEDFGQRIEGARKHRAARAWVEGLIDASDPRAESAGLGALWPAPSYDKLASEGCDRWLVAFAHALRDRAGAAPRHTRGGTFRYRRWRKEALALRALAVAALKGKIDPGDRGALDEHECVARAKADVSTRTRIYHDHGHATKIAHLEFERLRGGEKEAERWVGWERKGRMRLVRHECATQDALVRAVAETKGKGTARRTRNARERYQVREWRDDGTIWVTRRGTGQWARLIECASAQEGHRIIATEGERCEAAWKQWKEIPPMRPETSRPRTGPAPALGRIGPEEFTARVGLRGVQFGNWVGYARREDELLRAYLALHDLAEAVGWAIEEVALGGTLALAFGARGNGGRNAGVAHYERERKVINLTRNKGAGSLAHEWWHALDHRIATRAGRSGYATEHERGGGEGALDAAGTLAEAVRGTGLPARGAKLDARRSRPYWATMREMTARGFERHVCERARAAGVENDYLVRFTSFEAWTERARKSLEMHETHPYPTPDESEQLAPRFEAVVEQARERR